MKKDLLRYPVMANQSQNDWNKKHDLFVAHQDKQPGNSGKKS